MVSANGMASGRNARIATRAVGLRNSSTHHRTGGRAPTRKANGPVCSVFENRDAGFLCAKLGDTGKILHPQPLKNFGAAEFALTKAERAFDGFGHGGSEIC